MKNHLLCLLHEKQMKKCVDLDFFWSTNYIVQH